MNFIIVVVGGSARTLLSFIQKQHNVVVVDAIKKRSIACTPIFGARWKAKVSPKVYWNGLASVK
jgi:hypothetical protein